MTESVTTHHVAQINIARMRAAREDSIMAEFFENLDEINRLAEESPGFVWRLQSEAGDATSIRVNDDDRLLVNLSVWESVEHLKNYTYNTQHAQFLKRRLEWFQRPKGTHYALWWITKGRVPTIDEAQDRLRWLDKHGPSSHAFTFSRIYPLKLPTQSHRSIAIQK